MDFAVKTSRADHWRRLSGCITDVEAGVLRYNRAGRCVDSKPVTVTRRYRKRRLSSDQRDLLRLIVGWLARNTCPCVHENRHPRGQIQLSLFANARSKIGL
jgi:hypothetical protein